MNILMNIKKFIFDLLTSFGFGELMEILFPKAFDPHAKDPAKPSSGPKTEKANLFGFGKEDERLFWKACDLATKPGKEPSDGQVSIAEILVITDFSNFSHAHKRDLILYIGQKEDVIKLSEKKKNADGTPWDPSKNAGKKGSGGGPSIIETEQIVANTDGRQKIVFLAKIMRKELGKDENAMLTTFEAKDKTKAKKAIRKWLINSGILRDFSDQADEVAKEAEETARAFLNRLGIKGNTEELREHSEDFLQAARLKLEQAKAK